MRLEGLFCSVSSQDDTLLNDTSDKSIVMAKCKD